MVLSLSPDTTNSRTVTSAQEVVLPPGCERAFQQKEAIGRIRDVYLTRLKIAKKAKHRIKTMIRCQQLGERARRNVRIARKHIRKRRKAWLAMIALTPYNCGKGNGRYAVPCRIIECEGGYNNWDRKNSSGSGAYGPYQLLGWVPVGASPLAQHKAAARLWKQHGAQPWAASASCHGLA